MKILFCSSEVAPYGKTGGLGDVCASLPVALSKLGHEVNVIMPMYRRVAEGDFGLSPAVPGLYRAGLNPGVSVYFVENNELFSRDGIYGDGATDYPDNFRRFSFFCFRIIAVLKEINFQPDIIHCHDWQTSLVPFLLKTSFRSDHFYRRIKTLLTIHNIGYQGVFSLSDLGYLGLNNSKGEMEDLKLWGKVNLLKGGIVSSDIVNTVSPAYAREIQSSRFGFGLDEFLRLKGGAFFGILNGIDYDLWDPARDANILQRYSTADVSGKVINKEGLIKECSLDISLEMPLFALVSRLAGQKGINLLCEAIPDICRMNAALVVLGSGEARYESALLGLADKFRRRLSVHLKFDESLAHRVYAGADIFLMPSEYEPCGLSQMISMKYGTLPVAFKTGGLIDTVEEGKNGFLFDRYDPVSFIGALKRAYHLFQDRACWSRIMSCAMAADFSWDKSAVEYVNLYKRAQGVLVN